MLDAAAKFKACIEMAVKLLAKSGRQEDADAVEALIAEVAPNAGLLQDELRAAQEALSKFEGLVAGRVKLDKAMKEGHTSAALARALQV